MSPDESKPPTNYRRMRRQTDRHLLWLVIGSLLIVGGGFIYLIYGGGALATALVCLLPGVGIILFLWGLLSLIERWVGE